MHAEAFYPQQRALASHRVAGGRKVRTVRLDFRANEQRNGILAINPKGRVPAPPPTAGSQSAPSPRRAPKARLAPLDDAFAFARLQAFNSYLCATVHVAHAHRLRGPRWVDAGDAAAIAAMQKKVPQSVGECFELIEREMFAGPWVMGDGYTICDPYLFTVSRWLEGDGVDPARFPKVRDHRQRMAERPAVKAVWRRTGQ
jgi:glutathione S-transferase